MLPKEISLSGLEIKEELKFDMDTIIKINWLKIERLCTKVVRLINKDRYNPDIIITPQRGGLIPATIISHTLKVRDMLIVDIKRNASDDMFSSKIPAKLLSKIDKNKIKNRKILIVDDIVGHGKTLNVLEKYIGNLQPADVRKAVLVINEANFRKSKLREIVKIDYLGEKVCGGWILFPWEK